MVFDDNPFFPTLTHHTSSLKAFPRLLSFLCVFQFPDRACYRAVFNIVSDTTQIGKQTTRNGSYQNEINASHTDNAKIRR